jgi:hypothetical protein
MIARENTASPQPVVYDISLLTDDDLFLFNEGNHFRLYRKLGGACNPGAWHTGNVLCRLGPGCGASAGYRRFQQVE